MRILGLHGMGTSGPIFESQTSSFRSYLSPGQHTFDFPSGPFPSNPAPGIDVVYPPASSGGGGDDGYTYHAWYTILPSHYKTKDFKSAAARVRAACHWIDEYLDEHGPFDAVMGFSQGCALLSAWIMYRLQDAHDGMSDTGNSNNNLPVKAAMFVCGGLVLPVLSDLGVPVSDAAREVHVQTSRLLGTKAGRLVDYANAPNPEAAGWTKGTGLWDDTKDLVHSVAGNTTTASPAASAATENSKAVDLKNIYALDLSALDRSSSPDAASGPDLSHLRIPIPTVHVVGAKDPRYPAGIQLAHACDPARRTIYDHGGGHDIPRSTAVSRRLADLMDWLEDEVAAAARM